MVLVLFQVIAVCAFAYIQVNEGLDVTAGSPSPAPKVGLNITSMNFISPLIEKVRKYSTTLKNFVQKKLDELRIIYAGLMASLPSNGGPVRPPGAPVMQVTRPLAAAPRRPLDIQPLPSDNKTV